MLDRQSMYVGRVLTGLITVAIVTSCVTRAQESGGASGDIQLDSLLNLTVSSVSKYAQTTSEAPSSVTVITAEEIRLFGFRTIQDVLRTVPGFYVSNDHDYGYVGVRGFGRPGDYNSRLLLLVNGVVTNDPVFGSAYVGTEFAFNLASVERIEIVRGPSSAVYGTGAMFGVVNLILRNGVNFDGAHVSAETGNIGLQRGGVTCGANWGADWSLMVSGQAERTRGEDFYFKEFDSPLTNGGMARGLDGDQSAGVLSQLTYKGFSMSAGVSSRTKDVPTAPFGVVFNDPRTQTVDAMQFLSLASETALSPTSTLNVRVYQSGVDYHGQYPYDRLNYDASSGRVVGAEVLLHWDFPVGARLTTGAEFRRITRAQYRSWSEGVVYSGRDVPSGIYSGFAETEIQLFEPLRLVGGLRFDEYSEYGGWLSPRVALVCTPTGTTTLKVIYGEAHRVPNFYEANYDDPLGGIKSNPLLLPEKMRTVELACDQRITAALSARVSLYKYSMSNLIDETLDPVDSMNYFRNLGAVRTTGVESELLAVTKSGLRARLSYCYNNSHDLATGITLSNSPAHIFRLLVGGPLTPWLTGSGFIMHESPRLTLEGPWTPGYWTVDVTAAVMPFPTPLRFEIIVHNLFDTPYFMPGGAELQQASLLQSGRLWSAGLSLDF
jgi:iron complex outermembrane receptor protein